MSLVEHAERELRRAGFFDKNSDYDGMLGEAVVELVEVFAEQGHSGFSAHLTLDLFRRVAAYETLGPLTADPGEWMHIDEDVAGDASTWQSRRCPDAFSEDGGQTYYLPDEKPSRLARWFLRRRRVMHQSEPV